MADPVYNGIELIALTFAVALAAAVVLLVSHLMPHLADLMPGSTGCTRRWLALDGIGAHRTVRPNEEAPPKRG